MCGTPRPRGGVYNKSCHTLPHRERRQHSEKCVQQKLTPLKCCARPSSMEHFKCPSGVELPIGTQSSWPPLFGYRKNAKKKWVLVFHRSLLFDQTFQKLRPLSATIQENATFTVLSILEGFLFFCLFFASFLSFFALIRATLGFFVVFPNKSYTLIRATLGFEFFGPNKSYTLIRATFRFF